MTSQDKEKPQEVIRGGLPVVVLGTAERAFKDAATAHSSHGSGKFFDPHDPLRGTKQAMGVGFAAMSFSQSYLAAKEGETNEAIYNAAMGSLLLAGSVPVSRDAMAKAVAATPVAREAAKKLAGALDHVHLDTVRTGRVPLAGAALTGVSGVVAAADAARQGDYVKAGGDLFVTGAQVLTVTAGLVVGAAVCTPAAAVTGPAAPVTGALCARAVQVATFAASEAVTEIAAQSYNWTVGTASVRGSNIGALMQYFKDDMPKDIKEIRELAWARKDGVKLARRCYDVTESHDTTTQLVGSGCKHSKSSDAAKFR